MAKAAPKTQRALRILLVDDEPLLLRVTKRLLASDGYAVHATSSPRQALALVQQDPFGWDLVLTDGVMPYMTGQELVDEIREARPDMPCVIMSGYHVGDSLDGELVLLAKPFSPTSIRWAVHKATDG